MERRTGVAGYTYLPIVICTAAAYCILFGGNRMDTAEWITIVVALIGVVGALLVNYYQLRRDGKTIDGISSNTSEIHPTVKNINNNTEKTKEVILESIAPLLSKIEERNSKIDSIAAEVEYQKRLKSDFSTSASGKEVLIAGIQTVFEENARLNLQHKSDEEKIKALTSENRSLTRQVKRLRAELKTVRHKNELQKDCPDFDLEP